MDPTHAIFCCGAECGIAVAGTLSAGTEHWSTVVGSGVSVVTSGPTPMRSTRCFRINTSAATSSLTHTFATAIASPATTVMRAYVYFATLPSADMTLFAPDGNSAQAGPRFKQSDSKIYAAIAGTFGATGIAVTTGVWYRIDAVINRGADTCNVQVDGVACGQASSALADQVGTNWLLGHQSDVVTADYYVDDILVSGTSGDYPIGAGTVVGLYPNSDGTHSFSPAGDFAKGTSGATNATQTDTDLWQSLDNPLVSTAAGTWLADIAGISSEFVAINYDNLPANAIAVNAVMAVVTTHSASATQNQFTLLYVTDGSANSLGLSIITALDLSESTITIPCAALANSGHSGASTTWSVADVNAFLTYFSSGDVNPDVYWDGCCLEVDVLLYQPRVVQVKQAVQRAAVR